MFIANVLNCRPPGNRDPHPNEIERCQDYLFRKIELIEPVMIVTLGNFATKLLRGDPTGMTRLHGRAEVRVVGPRAVRLYPSSTRRPRSTRRPTSRCCARTSRRIPELLALGAPDQPVVRALEPEPEPEPDPEPVQRGGSDPGVAPAPALEPEPDVVQLGLF